MEKRRFQFSLTAIFVLTTVVAVSSATWPLVWEIALSLRLLVVFAGLLLSGYLLARLFWLFPDRTPPRAAGRPIMTEDALKDLLHSYRCTEAVHEVFDHLPLRARQLGTPTIEPSTIFPLLVWTLSNNLLGVSS